MTIEERMSRLEKAFGANDDLVRELRDAVTVSAYMEARREKIVKDHSEWLISHDQAMRAHDRAMLELKESAKTQQEQGRILDERIAKLVSGIGEFMRR